MISDAPTRFVRHVLLAICVATLALSGCGGDEAQPNQDEELPADGCEEDADCEAADQLCIADNCTTVDEPGELFVSTPPPNEVDAGESFEVGFELLDDDGGGVQLEGVDIEIALSQHQFATGDDRLVATTDDRGMAEFEPAIDDVASGYTITATTEARGLAELSVSTREFDVVGDIDVDFDPDASSITGEDGIDADGTSQADITIELIDRDGEPVAGVTPTFTASGEGNEYGDCPATDDDGISECWMTSTLAGDKTLELTNPFELTGETIVFESACAPDESPFGGGDGANIPFLLCDAEHLNAIAETPGVYGADFAIVEDIDMSDIDEFNVIGDADNRFNGELGADEKQTISNLTIDGEYDDPVGLFGAIGEDGAIGNVVLEDVDIDVEVDGDHPVGGLIGDNAGLVGRTEATGTIEATGGSTGGLVGYNAPGAQIFIAESDVDVSGQDGHTGGLVGHNLGDVLFGESAGPVEASQTDGEPRGAGGFVGRSDVGITYSQASGDVDVDGDDLEVGGFVGINTGSLNQSFTTGDITGTADRVGGFVGSNRSEGLLTHVYSSGDPGAMADTVGGFAGHHYDDPDDESAIIGGVWDTDNADTDHGVGDGIEDPEDDFSSAEDVIGLTTDEFGDADNFETTLGSFDFDDVWGIGTAPDGQQRPILEIEPDEL